MGNQQGNNQLLSQFTNHAGNSLPAITLPLGSIWTGETGEFAAYHTINVTKISEWPRICFRRNIFPIKITRCFSAHQIEYYWDKPMVISNPVKCPADSKCTIYPHLPIQKKANFSKQDIEILSLVINQTASFLRIFPAYEVRGKVKKIGFSFMGPASKVFTAHVLFIKITGITEEFHIAGLDGDIYSRISTFEFPLVLESGSIDAAFGLYDF